MIGELNVKQVQFDYDVKRIKRLRKETSESGIVGQDRGLSALKLGMSLKTKGYNIYLSGEDGTGRHLAVSQISNELGYESVDAFLCYNFINPEIPVLITAIKAKEIEKGMNDIIMLVKNSKFQEAQTIINDMINYFSTQDRNNYLLFKYFNQVIKALEKKDDTIEKYQIKIIFDSISHTKAPVVSEFYPTFSNIFRSLNNKADFNHLNIRAGSIFNAIGGYFVVDINQILAQNTLWEAIKLFAESSSFTIKEDDRVVRVISSEIPVKIILLGSGQMYDKLCETDDRFLRLFKICAEFDYFMEANDKNIKGIISYLERTVTDNKLKPLTDDGICKILRYGSWYAEMRDEITTKLSVLGDLLFEANFYSENEINAKSVEKAVDERKYFNGITEYRINKEIRDGEMLVSLSGAKIGVINGLAVMDRGLEGFGTPAVISVSVAPGNEGIVNIEHEAGLSGEIHDKGLLILEGYLRNKYARNFPLSIYAGICFEQSYSEIDGDSASSSELLALLSAIGNLPVRQEIAVTGSVNQMGDVQPVGGINEKVTGFFEICSYTGLNGKQGVIIPDKNINSLILPDNLVNAIKEGMFHIYPVSNIDQCMQILIFNDDKTDGKMKNFNKIIEKKLRDLYEMSRNSN